MEDTASISTQTQNSLYFVIPYYMIPIWTPYKLKLAPSWPIPLTLRKFRQIFLKIKPRGPPVRDMPRHKLEVIKLLITAKEPVETVR